MKKVTNQQLQQMINHHHEVWLELVKKVNDHSNEIENLKYPKEQNQVEAEQGRNLILKAGTTKPLSMANVEVQVCQSKGHMIMALERKVPNPDLPDPKSAFHQTMVSKQEILCIQCGMTLEEIRGGK